jgi:hypothetical protein
MNKTIIGFNTDIRPLFREQDIKAMIKKGRFDLSNYNDVTNRAQDILSRLEIGDMPCDGAWPSDQIELFKKWILGGSLP